MTADVTKPARTVLRLTAPRQRSTPAARKLYTRAALPEQIPFESDWAQPCPYPFAFMPRVSIARDAEQNDGTYDEATAEPSPDELLEARRELEAVASPEGATSTLASPAGIARCMALLADATALRDAVRRWKGVAHPLASFAPASIRTARGAVGVLCFATDLWTAACRGATLRANLAGRYEVLYDNGDSKGLTVARAFPTAYAAASYVCTQARQAREKALPRLLGTLPGWPPETPVLGATLDTIGQAPVQIDALPPVRSSQPVARTLWLRMSTDGAVLERIPLPWDDTQHLADVTASNELLVSAERAALVADLLRVDGMGMYFKPSGQLSSRKHKPTVWWGHGTKRGTLTGDFRRGAAGEVELCIAPAGEATNVWIAASCFARTTSFAS